MLRLECKVKKLVWVLDFRQFFYRKNVLLLIPNLHLEFDPPREGSLMQYMLTQNHVIFLIPTFYVL